MIKIKHLALFFFMPTLLMSQEVVKEFQIEKQYLNFPVEMKQESQRGKLIIKKDTIMDLYIRLADGEPDYWVFKDVSDFKGKKLKIVFPNQIKGVDRIYQSDSIAGEDSLYKESNRPQFHFTSRRGWNNDPNGLVYYDGEYHLFYQHNPYETEPCNTHWGHAVSRDLLHWEELNDALYPDETGMMFSGSAVIDKKNSSGFGKNALIAAYSACGTEIISQCIAYSTNKGRTFTKYQGNPVIDNFKRSGIKYSRDPKVFWYEPTQTWVMALFEDNFISIYNSNDLKNWEYKSKTT